MRPAVAICRELTTDRRSDGELLVAFTSGPSEEAFAELVRRHGPLVWGACRRLLPNSADAEDAFQAAFLVLVRRARRLTHYPTLAPWRHRVAVWTSRNVRRKNARRLARFSGLPEHVPDTSAPDADLKADLDAALLALPARYRDPILLCHLQGFTRREAAERLGCPEGTLSAWLSRGLAKLRTRLRGLDPTKVLSVATVSVPAALSVSTAQAAVATRVAAASIPPTVSVLVEGVIHMLWMRKATAATFALCAVFALGVGVGLSTRVESSGAIASEEKPAVDPKPEATDAKLIADLEEGILIAELFVKEAAGPLLIAKSRVEIAKSRGDDPKKLKARLDEVAACQKEVDDATAYLRALNDALAAAKAGKPGIKLPDALLNRAKAITLLEYEVRRRENEKEVSERLLKFTKQMLEFEKQSLEFDRQMKLNPKDIPKVDPKETQKRLADLKQYQHDVEEATKKLKSAQAMLSKLNVEALKLTRGYLELTISGKAGEYVFELKETDATGKELGTVRALGADAALLTRLLARTKADPAGPTELRVIAQPQTALGNGPLTALKSCNAAGYKNIKFTGYVYSGGLARELGPNQKGHAAGYTRYDKAEKNPAELVKEIEDGLRRW